MGKSAPGKVLAQVQNSSSGRELGGSRPRGAYAAGVNKGEGRCENHQIGPGQGTRESLTLSEKERFSFHKNYIQNTSSTSSGN